MLLRQRWLALGLLLLGSLLSTACTFNFELTSQRTALENQVMGSYRDLDDDLVLSTSVRAPDKQQKAAQAPVSPSKRRALDARQNQEFNRDDVDELKDKQLLGETTQGTLALLPNHLTAKHTGPKAQSGDIKLAKQLLDEENRDRAEIWRRIIEANENLSAADLPDVRRTYAKMQREAAKSGQWYQNEDQEWVRKDGQSQAVKSL